MVYFPFSGRKMRTIDDVAMDRNTGDASQPPTSSNTTSDAVAVEEVRQEIRAEFAQGLRSSGINPDFHKLHLGSSIIDATSDTATHSHSIIDLCTPSSVPPILPSPLLVASTSSNARNGGSALGFLHLSHATHAVSPPPIFATTT